jgi:hypothetical protein
MNNLGLCIRDVETALDVGFIEFQSAYSVGIYAARIGFHESPGGHIRLLFWIAQFLEDLLGISC